mmetsp:Transcript_27837/g.54759  ORF Transcript_27837/g.54759 Transcript_27837/m.54759 type:complete len:490 (+) Transcript_27837:83-1552(+)
MASSLKQESRPHVRRIVIKGCEKSPLLDKKTKPVHLPQTPLPLQVAAAKCAANVRRVPNCNVPNRKSVDAGCQLIQNGMMEFISRQQLQAAVAPRPLPQQLEVKDEGWTWQDLEQDVPSDARSVELSPEKRRRLCNKSGISIYLDAGAKYDALVGPRSECVNRRRFRTRRKKVRHRLSTRLRKEAALTVVDPATPCFDEPGKDFLQHLEHHGYAVLRGILGSDEMRSHFLDMFWTAMQQVVPRTQRNKRRTWQFPRGFRGIVSSYGLPQADFAWMVRQAPLIHRAFAEIFETEDLVSSLDAVIMEEGVPKNKLKPWLHKDQRPQCKQLSVQAVYSFFPSGPYDTGTCVVPGSHRKVYPWEHGATKDFLPVPENSGLQALKLCIPADSAVFFNSRLIHANQAGAKVRPPDPVSSLPQPSRLGVAVAFAPRDRRSENTRIRKESVYFSGRASTHWPCDRFQVKKLNRVFQRIKGVRKLERPPAVPERLALL